MTPARLLAPFLLWAPLFSIQAAEPETEKKKTKSPWNLHAQFRYGYDSNVALESDEFSSPSSDTESNFNDLSARVSYRRKADNGQRQNFDLHAQALTYDSLSVFNQTNYGLTGSFLWSRRKHMYGSTVALHNFTIDNKDAVTALTVGLRHSYFGMKQNIFLSSLDFQVRDYDASDLKDGNLILAKFSYWNLFDKRNVRQRFELTLRAGVNDTDLERESYTTIRPEARLRFGWRAFNRRWVYHGRLQYEQRDYDGARIGQNETESFGLIRFRNSIDFYFTRRYSAGIFLDYSSRDSNIIGRSYDRNELGLKIMGKW